MSRSCSRCETPLADEDIRCAVCALPAVEDRPVRAAAQAQILRCEECAAAITYTVEAQALKCAFCGSVMHLEIPEDPIEEAEGYLPFTVTQDQARASVGQWLGTLGFFRPSDLQSQAAIDKLEPLWWVGWVFDAETLISWTADSNAGARRSAWAPHSGQNPLSMQSILVSASRGLTEKESSQLASHFQLGSAAPKPHGPNGASADTATIERFDVQRSAARQTIAEAVQASAARYAQAWIPGSTFRNLHTAVLLRRLQTKRFAFPTYVMAYRYNDKVYRALVHGQDASCVLGSAPYSVIKIALTVAAVVAVVLLVLVVLSIR